MQRPRLRRCAIGMLLLVAFASRPAAACSVPVFRYALERWPADPYEVVIFHRGTLAPELTELAESLGPAAEQSANVRITTADLDTLDRLDPPGEADLALLALWESQQTDTLPWMIIRYPAAARKETIVWSGEPSRSVVEQLFRSPIRQQIARQLLTGHTAVWVMLESGDGTKDDAAFAKLQERLDHAEGTLKLPEIAEEDIAAGLVSVDPTLLKISFPLVRLSRDDPAERMFVEMLLGTEPDLRSAEFAGEPMVFPIFGRGRALYALIGAGINEETIAIACETLVGPCTCQVKDENPGTDLLMAVDWDNLVQSTLHTDKPLPPLPGLAVATETEPSPERLPSEASIETEPLPDPPRERAVDEPAAHSAPDHPAEPAVAEVSERRISPLVRNLLIAGGVIITL
ncbi:MAG: hypothetical protein ACREIV_05305, partial [Planctomycetaceae bacterium]